MVSKGFGFRVCFVRCREEIPVIIFCARRHVNDGVASSL